MSGHQRIDNSVGTMDQFVTNTIARPFPHTQTHPGLLDPRNKSNDETFDEKSDLDSGSSGYHLRADQVPGRIPNSSSLNGLAPPVRQPPPARNGGLLSSNNNNNQPSNNSFNYDSSSHNNPTAVNENNNYTNTHYSHNGKRFRSNMVDHDLDDAIMQQQHLQQNQHQINLSHQHALSSLQQYRLRQEELEEDRRLKEQKYQKSLKSLSVHSWFQVVCPQERQTLFCKTRIAFPELPICPTSRQTDQQQQQQPPPPLDLLHTSRSTISITTNIDPGSDPTTRSSISNRQPAVGREQCPLLFDSTPRIIGNDMDASIWSKSITCLLNQSCDAVYTFVCTLCYYFKILRILSSNYNRVIQLHVPVALTGNEPKNPEGDYIRQKQTYTITLGSKESKHLFFIACNILSMKFHDDFYHTNKIFSKVYKLPIQFLNELEMKCYALLGWNLYLSDVVIGQVLRELISCIEPNYNRNSQK